MKDLVGKDGHERGVQADAVEALVGEVAWVMGVEHPRSQVR
jgi:hypothetical protein